MLHMLAPLNNDLLRKWRHGSRHTVEINEKSVYFLQCNLDESHWNAEIKKKALLIEESLSERLKSCNFFFYQRSAVWTRLIGWAFTHKHTHTHIFTHTHNFTHTEWWQMKGKRWINESRNRNADASTHGLTEWFDEYENDVINMLCGPNLNPI